MTTHYWFTNVNVFQNWTDYGPWLYVINKIAATFDVAYSFCHAC